MKSLAGCLSLVLFVSCAPQARAVTATNIYELNSSFIDSLGGPNLVPTSGSLGASDFTFGNPVNSVNEGLSVSNALVDPADYSIEMRFRWTGDDGGWGRILDFKDSSTDFGLYTRTVDNLLVFHGLGFNSSTAMVILQDYHLVVTRDGTTGSFRAYLDGTQEFSFSDGGGGAIFSGTNDIVHFFPDDNTPADTRPGIVDQIRIFDGVLTQQDVTHLFNLGSPFALPSAPSIPEPSTFSLGIVGLLSLLWHRRRNR